MMDNSVHILLIEDDPAHAELIQRAFEDRGGESRLTIANTLEEARAHLKNFKPTLIIADWRLPDGESSELLPEDHNKSTPIIIMTSYGNERNAVNVMKSGALDYIVKSSESMTDMPHIAEKAIEQWEILQQRESMQIALAESEAQFRLLAENSSDMISKHDTNGIFLYVSPACRTLLGYEPEELIGTPVAPLLHPEDASQLINLLATPLWDGVNVTVYYRARRKNGEYLWLETTARRFIDDKNDQQPEFQASSRDITDRKQSQEALQKAHFDLQEAYDKTIEGWVLALDLRDRETEGHTKRVTEMTVKLARQLNCTEEEIIHIRRGALLHDIGKMGIPDEILQKPGPLTDDEWVIMRRHPQYAYQMLAPINYLKQALIIPYYHHERWDGSGYPHKLNGQDIPLFARLFSVVDVWDALSSDRPYRKGMPPKEVIDYLQKESGRLFDLEIVNTFLPLITGQ